MTMQECYEAIGGNYEAVLGRLHSEALIRRFALKFLEDQSYIQLKQALENKNYEDAFRGAHTLKGVCQNLSFGQQSLFLVENGMKQIIRIDNTLHQNIRTALTHDAHRFARRFILVFNMQRLHIFGIFL